MSVDLDRRTVKDSADSDVTWGRTVVLVVGVWLVLGAIVVGWGWLLTHPLTDSVGAGDNDLARWWADQRSPDLTDVADVGTLLGETIVELVAAPIIAIAFSFWKRSWIPGLFVLLVASGIGGFYYVGTQLAPRDRPPVKILDPGLVPSHSFPSGHVGTAIALYGSFVILVWVYLRAARWWVTPLLLLPVFVLVSRLYEGAHHLSDVLTSVVYATAWLAAIGVLLFRGHAYAARLKPTSRARER